MAEIARNMEGGRKLRSFPQGRSIDQVVFVGGATRMPCVQVLLHMRQALHNAYNKKPVLRRIDVIALIRSPVAPVRVGVVTCSSASGSSSAHLDYAL